jgi:hypothetical protein
MTGTRTARAVLGHRTRRAGSFTLVFGLALLIADAHTPARAQLDARLSTSKRVYAPNEPVVVAFAGFPGNDQDWVTVVKAAAPRDSYAQWSYTRRRREGQLTFDGLPPGNYEARAYFDWPAGGYSVRSRVAFRVVAAPRNTLRLRTRKSVYNARERVVVEFTGFPGNARDWVTVVPASTPTDRYAQWEYTSGKREGDLSFAGLPAGEYEARAYFNWPAGGYSVRARYAFTVR